MALYDCRNYAVNYPHSITPNEFEATANALHVVFATLPKRHSRIDPFYGYQKPIDRQIVIELSPCAHFSKLHILWALVVQNRVPQNSGWVFSIWAGKMVEKSFARATCVNFTFEMFHRGPICQTTLFMCVTYIIWREYARVSTCCISCAFSGGRAY